MISIHLQIGHWNIERPYSETGIEMGRKYLDLIWEWENEPPEAKKGKRPLDGDKLRKNSRRLRQ